MKKLTRVLLLIAAFAMFATACGSGSSSDTATESEPAEDTAAEDTADDTGADDTAAEDTADADTGEDTEDMSEEDMAEEEDAAAEDDMSEEEDAAAAPAGDGATVGLVYDIGGRGDQSFNDSAYAGLERAQNELGATVAEVSPNDDGSNRSELLQLQADSNDLVIGVGFLFRDSAIEVAPNNPDVKFAVVDDSMLDYETGEPLGENTVGLTFAEEQGSFLVGAAAALKSETGKVGFIGGVSGLGLIEKFEAGFIAGATAVNPDIEVVSQYLTQAPDMDGFNAPDQAKETAAAMYDQGIDIVYHAAGGSGGGMFEAAKEYSEANDTKVWGIGVDSDQYNTVSPDLQDYVLTSMLKRVDNAVFQIIEAVGNDGFTAGNTVYDLSTEGVGYATSGGFVDDIADQLEDYKAQIIDGTIVVPTEP